MCNKNLKKRLIKILKKISLKFYLSFFVFIFYYILGVMRMKQDKQIHPRISETTREILKMYKIKPADALEQYAIDLVANDKNLSYEYDNLLTLKETYNEIIEKASKELKKIDKRLNEIDKLKELASIPDSKNLSDAVRDATKLLANVVKQLENTNKHGIKKVTIDEIDAIAKNYHVPLQKLLERLDKSLMKFALKNYEMYI